MTPARDPGNGGGRGRARRRFALWAAVMALVLLAAGVVLIRHGSSTHELGVTCVGYGIGVGVAAAFLALGFEPWRR
jgi:hypothetical protein